ncbi:hypothetical protein D1AOALGA4SA_2124 [Olavius algarvensis Delta 1 endosymbiont]|nr:hypothetical protein D1AOALGA4SA_2124 [Olavius algarvensis Delta 1 endosymbiont]
MSAFGLCPPSPADYSRKRWAEPTLHQFTAINHRSTPQTTFQFRLLSVIIKDNELFRHYYCNCRKFLCNNLLIFLEKGCLVCY